MKTDNELIAEFMGLDFSQYQSVSSFEPPKYHSSWDWLMPVVEKISDLAITPTPNYKGYRIEIVPSGYVRISGFPMPTLTTNVSIEGSLIAAVYRAVVEFIKFYNAQPK